MQHGHVSPIDRHPEPSTKYDQLWPQALLHQLQDWSRQHKTQYAGNIWPAILPTSSAVPQMLRMLWATAVQNLAHCATLAARRFPHLPILHVVAIFVHIWIEELRHSLYHVCATSTCLRECKAYASWRLQVPNIVDHDAHRIRRLTIVSPLQLHLVVAPPGMQRPIVETACADNEKRFDGDMCRAREGDATWRICELVQARMPEPLHEPRLPIHANRYAMPGTPRPLRLRYAEAAALIYIAYEQWQEWWRHARASASSCTPNHNCYEQYLYYVRSMLI